MGFIIQLREQFREVRDTNQTIGPPPLRLDTPATAILRPPTTTQLQELPFRELTWEDFERLCLRLAREEAEVEYCRQYGTKGQSQAGIDLYARKPRWSPENRPYVVTSKPANEGLSAGQDLLYPVDQDFANSFLNAGDIFGRDLVFWV